MHLLSLAQLNRKAIKVPPQYKKQNIKLHMCRIEIEN